MTRFAIATAVAVSLLAAAAQAQQTGGVKINGVATNTTVANGNVNAATGFLAEAQQSIGSIRAGTEVNGMLLNTTVANGNVNAATGFLAEACQEIGTIGNACSD
jgi:hypothetical protein